MSKKKYVNIAIFADGKNRFATMDDLTQKLIEIEMARIGLSNTEVTDEEGKENEENDKLTDYSHFFSQTS